MTILDPQFPYPFIKSPFPNPLPSPPPLPSIPLPSLNWQYFSVAMNWKAYKCHIIKFESCIPIIEQVENWRHLRMSSPSPPIPLTLNWHPSSLSSPFQLTTPPLPTPLFNWESMTIFQSMVWGARISFISNFGFRFQLYWFPKIGGLHGCPTPPAPLNL